MNPTQKFGKLLLGTSLSLSLLFTGGMLIPPQAAHAAQAAPVSASTSIADNIAATGKQFMGVPYKFGSKSGVTSTFDCSSFTQYVFKQNGISLPRDSRQQSRVGTYVSRDQLKPGDLVFFYNPIHHVAIYIGNGQLLHTYGKPGVTITSLSSWESRINTIRRVLPDNGQAVDPTNTTSPDQGTNIQPTTQPDPTDQSPSHPYNKTKHRHGYRNYNQQNENE